MTTSSDDRCVVSREGRVAVDLDDFSNLLSRSRTTTTTTRRSLPSCTNSSYRRASSSCKRDFGPPRRCSVSRRESTGRYRPTCWRDRSSMSLTSKMVLRTPLLVPRTFLRFERFRELFAGSMKTTSISISASCFMQKIGKIRFLSSAKFVKQRWHGNTLYVILL